MKDTLIIALTRRGAALGQRLQRRLPQSELLVPERFASGTNGDSSYRGTFKEAVTGAFGKYPNLVIISAVAVAVRTLAPLLRGKLEDPAVVVLDERGHYAVSLLGGHARRANALARKLAFLSGAQPVVTTASDGGGLPPLDLLGAKYGWALEDGAAMTRVLSAMVNDEAVAVYQDGGETGWGRDKLPTGVTFVSTIAGIAGGGFAAALLITDLEIDTANLPAHVIYRPRGLTVGIGCHPGTSVDELEAAVREALASGGYSPRSVAAIATIDARRGEPAFTELAARMAADIKYFTPDELRAVAGQSPPSAAALKALGLPAVAEPAAILAAGNGEMVLPKRKSANVTVALAARRENADGKLYIVGTGPGDTAQLTLRARQALGECDVVLGYGTYLRYIRELLDGKEIVSSDMRQELDRARQAIAMAAAGRRVALVSGGDPGVYGMSAAVYELLENGSGSKVEVEVLPGVPAVCAAAARLGAPLSGDFACISLSDLLTPWDVIISRLRAAAAADFVIAIYNPRSRGRPDYLAEARRVLLEHRPPETSVGIVRGAYRDGEEEVCISDLEHMMDFDADMVTTLIIGNDTTHPCRRLLLTPRGYRRKYDRRK